MPRGDHFQHSAHAHGISPPLAVHAGFGRAFHLRPMYTDIHATFQPYAQVSGAIQCQPLQPGIKNTAHIREAFSPALMVGASQGGKPGMIDLVGNAHQVASFKARVQCPGRIGNHQGVCSQARHKPYAHTDLCRAAPLVQMAAALLGHHRHIPQPAEQKRATVRIHTRQGHTRHIRKGDTQTGAVMRTGQQLPGQRRQARAKYQGKGGTLPRPGQSGPVGPCGVEHGA